MELTILAFVAVLGPIILLHEIGHFIGAKLTGVRVEEFGLGWPPRMFQFWRSAGYLEIGRFRVEIPRNRTLPSNLERGRYVSVTARRKENGDYLLQELRVLDRTDDSTPCHEQAGDQVHVQGVLTQWEPGTAYTFNWIPVGGFCKMTGEEDPSDPRSLAAQPKRERLLVLLGGPVTNLLIAIALFTSAFVSGVPEPVDSYVVIRDIAPGSPAEAAGLQINDVVLKADGINVADIGELIDVIDAHAGQTITLTLRRGDEIVEREVAVRAQREPDGRVGIVIRTDADNFVLHRSSLPEALTQGVDQFWFSTKQMLSLPAMLIRGQISADEVKPVGPVGISQIAGDAIERSHQEQSWFTVLFFAGAISMALGLTNLLPLPALDGGRIMFVVIEAIRGQRIDPAKEGLVHLIGLALLLSLLLFMTFQELVNPVTSPF